MSEAKSGGMDALTPDVAALVRATLCCSPQGEKMSRYFAGMRRVGGAERAGAASAGDSV
jgi:hypothetical protein